LHKLSKLRVPNLTSKLVTNNQSFDTDGKLSYDEFKTGCELLNEHMPEGKEAFHNPEQLWVLLNINDQVGNLASERVAFPFPMRSPQNHLTYTSCAAARRHEPAALHP